MLVRTIKREKTQERRDNCWRKYISSVVSASTLFSSYMSMEVWKLREFLPGGFYFLSALETKFMCY